MAFNYQSDADLMKKKQDAESHSAYNASDTVLSARNNWQQHSANKVGDWTGGTYGQQLNDTLNKITSRPKFSYDLNADMLYQQYKDQYMNLGNLAMQDTIGQASALTGGYGNSYAVTAGNQAYQGYLDKLNDVIPSLYQMALDRYDREGNDLKDQYSLLNQAYGTEYGEYRDRVADWNTEEDRLYNIYNNESQNDWNRFASDRDYYLNLWNSAYDRAFANYQQGVSEAQFAQQMAARSSGGSGGGGGSKKSATGSDSNKLSANTDANINLSPAEWNKYFTDIRKEESADAAVAELKKLSAMGVIPKEAMASASIGARGKVGH